MNKVSQYSIYSRTITFASCETSNGSRVRTGSNQVRVKAFMPEP